MGSVPLRWVSSEKVHSITLASWRFICRRRLRLLCCAVSSHSPPLHPAFVHVPGMRNGDTWSAGITEDELGRFVWLKPKVKATVQYQEWTRAGYLRHVKLRELVFI